MRATVLTALGVALSLSLCGVSSAENWPRFRGPNGQGISSETDLPVTWSAKDNVNWSADIPGKGWSSPIVYKDHIFLTTAMEAVSYTHLRAHETN